MNRTDSNNEVINDFSTKLRECTVHATCGRPYVLVKSLRNWLKEEVSNGTNRHGRTTRASRLLRAAYADYNEPNLPFSYERLTNGQDSCIDVFCILLYLGHPDLINRFQTHDIVDRRLPMRENELKYKMEAMGLSKGDAEMLVEEFYIAQWRFRAAELDIGGSKKHHFNIVIPICKKMPINSKGGTARLWCIYIQEEFVSPGLQRMVSVRSKVNDPKFGQCCLFALKTFKKKREHIFNNEKGAFQALRNHKGMVRYLGDYEHAEVHPQDLSSDSEGPHSSNHREVRQTTHNILLEYGEMDLDEYFWYNQPPVLRTEVKAFWKALCEVADTVKGMHIFEDEKGHRYRGCHADIKPDNILRVEGIFKLADPGFAIFKRLSDKSPRKPISGGTETYGPPERFSGGRSRDYEATQALDIWSLGCLFSIAATWIALGYQGIKQLSRMREIAIEKIVETEKTLQRPQEVILALAGGDYFHNSEDVLPDILSWHKMIRNALRKTDTTTSQILDLVDVEMLRGDPNSRATAEAICVKLEQILGDQQAEFGDAISENIMKALLEVDNQASSEPEREENLSFADSQETKAGKLKLLGPEFRKTAHRSETLSSALNLRHSTATAFRPSIPANHWPYHKSIAANNGDPKTTPTRQNTSSTTIESRYIQDKTADKLSLSIPKHLAPATDYHPRNVFQVREDIEKREKEKGVFAKLMKPRKDENLTGYFGKEGRDIKFLVDNAGTMREHWYEATYLVETLVMQAFGQDDDGMDLSFLKGDCEVRGKSAKSEFTDAMKKNIPLTNNQTDLRKALGEIFDLQLDKIKRRRGLGGKVKNLTLIILTDGIWGGVANKDEVKDLIVKFIKLVKAQVDLKDRPVSIQFIQFGNNPEATTRLDKWDNNLNEPGVPDVIDTERFFVKGDVNKMLLGSFVELYDRLDEVQSPHSQESDPNLDFSQDITQSASSSRPPTARQSMSPRPFSPIMESAGETSGPSSPFNAYRARAMSNESDYTPAQDIRNSRNFSNGR